MSQARSSTIEKDSATALGGWRGSRSLAKPARSPVRSGAAPGRQALPLGQARGAYRPLTWTEVADVVSTLSRGLRGIGCQAGRPGSPGLGEPAGVADRRSRDHVCRCDHGAGLHHQQRRRPHSHPDATAARSAPSSRPRPWPTRLLPAAIDAPDCRWVDRQIRAAGRWARTATVETYDWWASCWTAAAQEARRRGRTGRRQPSATTPPASSTPRAPAARPRA